MNGDLYAKAFCMLGKIVEQRGEESHAHDHCQKFLSLWKDAGPGLCPVEDAERG